MFYVVVHHVFTNFCRFNILSAKMRKTCLHLTVESNHVFGIFSLKMLNVTELCENITNNYVKHWKHTLINPKGKMPLASIEELESEEIKISSDGDRNLDLVREGNDVVDCSILFITLCLYSQFNSLNSNANCNLHRRYFRCDCTFRQQQRRKILLDAMH